uniref:Uncharacterized protein n=1 Tax=Arundo donax TaxID=35708 RepID=A0A0A9BS65_ARUDO
MQERNMFLLIDPSDLLRCHLDFLFAFLTYNPPNC